MDNIKEDILNTNITDLHDVFPGREKLLKSELDITTFRDLLYRFPREYIDCTHFCKIKDIQPDKTYVQLYGKITSMTTIEGKRKGLVYKFSDGTGVIDLVFFNKLAYFKDNIKIGENYIVFEQPSVFHDQLSMVHPEIDRPNTENVNVFSARMKSIYPSTKKLKNGHITNKVFTKLMINVLKQVWHNIPETLPDYIIKREGLMSLPTALLNIHFPQSNELLEQARTRLKFDESFYLQLGLLRQKHTRKRNSRGFVFSKVGDNFNYFYKNNLPFPLTEAQKRVIREMRSDLGNGRQMNRLLQGDVGSGKTLVALMIMLIAIDNGFQACMMAPTEILATQHFDSVTQFLKGMNIKVAILTGSTKKRLRTVMFNELAEGEINILIGTHAVIEDNVRFKNLGMVIIDEQHRFGVEQRARLWNKAEITPHVLVMTATPIPRTLAMTAYGDLDISVIDELPPGRKPVKTVLYNDDKRRVLFGFLQEQIAQGRQVYVVYPLIKESETMDYKDLEDGYNSIVRAFPPPTYVTAVMHGQMKAADKDFSMNLFASGKAHIMVATSVIEVGVNVPNASVMVIESAERFGLSQLHQLRGRVGRGADQSYCVLMEGKKISAESRKRLELMVSTSDGFKIAEEDLKMRGPGDLGGTQQSGLPFKLRLVDLKTDSEQITKAKELVENLLKQDPDLNKAEHLALKNNLNSAGFKKDFSKIS